MKSFFVGGVAGALVSLLVLTAGCTPKSSGETGTGGSGGVSDASSDGATGPVCPVMEDLISAFTTDNGLNATAGLQGGWYTYADSSGFGTLLPPQGSGGVFNMADAGTDPSFGVDLTVGDPGCSGPGSWHVMAVNFTDWGAATGVDFVPKTTNDAGVSAKGTYDASKYRGVSFWAKSAPGTAVKFVQVSFLDPYTAIPSILPASQVCVYDATMPTTNCSPYLVKFGYGYTGDDATALASDYPSYVNDKIDDTWRRFEVLFADTKQDRNNPGQQSPGNKLVVSQLTGMAIQVNSDHSTTPPTNNDFEIWIDDVTFIK